MASGVSRAVFSRPQGSPEPSFHGLRGLPSRLFMASGVSRAVVGPYWGVPMQRGAVTTVTTVGTGSAVGTVGQRHAENVAKEHVEHGP